MVELRPQPLRGPQPIDAKHLRRFLPRHHQLRDHFAGGRRQLEAVAGAAAGDEDVAGVRVAIDDQVSVGAVLVLANLGGQQRRVREPREALGEELPRAGESLRGRRGLRLVGSTGAPRVSSATLNPRP